MECEKVGTFLQVKMLLVTGSRKAFNRMMKS
jgi:hypothetical protein